MRDVFVLTRELRGIYKALDDLQRRQAAAHMTGKVVAIDGDQVRLELLPADDRTGKPFLSPWVQVQEAAGATGSHFPVRVGDPMRLFSPQGELGPQSLAIRDSYTTDAPNPAANDELVIAHGNCAIRMKGGELVFEAESTVRARSNGLFHNEKNVGEDHKHTGVRAGSDISSIPV